jgi:hypothetical protein
MATAKRRPASQKNCLYIILILRAPIFPLKGKGNFSARLCADARTAGIRLAGKKFSPLKPLHFLPARLKQKRFTKSARRAILNIKKKEIIDKLCTSN